MALILVEGKFSTTYCRSSIMSTIPWNDNEDDIYYWVTISAFLDGMASSFVCICYCGKESLLVSVWWQYLGGVFLEASLESSAFSVISQRTSSVYSC